MWLRVSLLMCDIFRALRAGGWSALLFLHYNASLACQHVETCWEANMCAQHLFLCVPVVLRRAKRIKFSLFQSYKESLIIVIIYTAWTKCGKTIALYGQEYRVTYTLHREELLWKPIPSEQSFYWYSRSVERALTWTFSTDQQVCINKSL